MSAIPTTSKVDTEGNQLPYTDKVTVEYVGNLEVANLKAISGELSSPVSTCCCRTTRSSSRTRRRATTRSSWSTLNAALTLPWLSTPTTRTRCSRRSSTTCASARRISLAINRNEINELVFLGQGTPRAGDDQQLRSFFNKKWADAYAKFDLAQANKLLDAVGLDKKGADGFRLRPDGKPMAFQIEYLPDEGPKKETFELVVKHCRLQA